MAFAAALLLQACGEAPGAPARDTDATSAVAQALTDAPPSADMGARLRAIPGMTVVVDRWLNASRRTRRFVLQYEQPADHQRPEGERFRQRMTLLYRASEPGAPVVLYGQFLDSVGDDPGCRERLRAFQVAALQRREELLPFMAGLMAAEGTTSDALGLERSFEFAVVEAPFYFWRYSGQEYCPTLPAPDAPAAELFGFLDFHPDIASSYGDAALETFQAYYYQAATQLGAPRYPAQHLHGLLRYPRQDIPAHYPPLGVEKKYAPQVQLRVKHWVRNEAQRMLFLYGATDPWSAHPFEVRERNDAFRFFVPHGSHSARLMDLPEPERTQALERLLTWAGRAPSLVTAEVGDDLPTVNPAGLRRRALPAP